MAKILDAVREPADLRTLRPDELSRLAMEVRALILETVARNGGHLASNLGAVELTLALHLAFDSPRDKIVWDVGHQCYTHKILTGRRDRFAGLRRWGGLLGFPCREESEHDVFNTGHASTALSAALGLAVARDRAGEGHHVVAVVGDGSLTGGVALEALNQIGHLRERLIIVLNFNEMSISINVGAWSKYFSYLVSGQRYIQIKDQAKSFLRRVPLGRAVIKAGRALEELAKKMLFPGLVFKELGIRYIGPVHGHNIQSLVEAFEAAKSHDGPVLIQCVTQKGRGYPPARLRPEKFHGAGPFQVTTGEPLSKDWGPSYSSVFGQAMIEIARREPKVLAVTAAMGEGTGLREFSERLPDRFFDVGIAEQHAVTFAAGLAVAGLKPVVAIYSTFLQRAYDQVYHDVCLMGLPVVFVLDRAGIVPDDGPTHQGINDIAFLRTMPNMVLMAPKDEGELRHMLWSALAYGRPAAVRFPKAKGLGVPLDAPLEVLPLGRSELVREGTDLIFAVGHMVRPAVETAEALAREGLSFAVVNARFVKPLDRDAILRFAGPGRTVVTLEEGVVEGGAGSAVRELLDREGRFGIRFLSLGLPVGPYALGKAEEIRAALGLDVPGLVRRIKAFRGTPFGGGDEGQGG
ncbi:MAG TPA: 1-deoxy-D-xylulose-5-phosphate synthase [Candidatus Aminicenantes bacterium]|nr:1-deoxy-D-xylulose-5-phosphate synthase [Candidatus Aminicenantes bacterium]